MLLASWRFLRIVGLILRGLVQVRVGLPAPGTAPRAAVVQAWARDVLRVLGVDLRSAGSPPAPGPKGLMLVANHVSWLDVIVLQALCPEARFVAKSDVQRWPVIGALVSGAGALFVDRHRSRGMRVLVDEMAGLLRNGSTLIVFPEGTTSDGRRVLPFHASLLQAAHEAGSPVQAIALRYADSSATVAMSIPYIDDDSFIGSLWRVCRAHGVSATVQWLAVRQPADNRRQMAQHLRTSIVQALDAMERPPSATHPLPSDDLRMP